MTKLSVKRCPKSAKIDADAKFSREFENFPMNDNRYHVETSGQRYKQEPKHQSEQYLKLLGPSYLDAPCHFNETVIEMINKQNSSS